MALKYTVIIISLKLNLLMPKKILKTVDLTKIFVVPWDKNSDNFLVPIFNEKQRETS